MKKISIGTGLAFALALAAGCGDETVLEAPPAPELAPAVFVVNSLGETLSRILIADGSVAANALALGAGPNAIVVSDDGRTGYVASSLSNRIDAVDLGRLAISKTIDLGPGANPYAIALTADGRAAYVSNLAADEVARIDLAAGQVARRIRVGRGPEGFLVAGGDLYVAVTGYRPEGYDPGEVAVVAVPADTVRARLRVGLNPQALAPAPDGTIHVLCTGDYGAHEGRVFVIEPSGPAVVDSLDVGGAPAAILVLDDGRGVIAGFFGGLRRYDRAARSVEATRALGTEAGLSALALDGATGRLYVADFDDDQVHLVDLAADSLLTSFTVGDGPVSLAVRR
jgi:DNA-binding beta-propeller fold protein YncE